MISTVIRQGKRSHLPHGYPVRDVLLQGLGTVSSPFFMRSIGDTVFTSTLTLPCIDFTEYGKDSKPHRKDKKTTILGCTKDTLDTITREEMDDYA